jgi:hypothetical protein
MCKNENQKIEIEKYRQTEKQKININAENRKK